MPPLPSLPTPATGRIRTTLMSQISRQCLSSPPILRVSRHLSTQPLFHTHPHLLRKGELTPYIHRDEFEARRKHLFDQLPCSSALVVSASPEQTMSFDIPFQFRQNTNFLYLTGFLEPESVLVLEKQVGGQEVFHLFVSPNDAKKTLWDGECCGTKNAIKHFGAHYAHPIGSLTSTLTDIFTRTHTIYHSTDAAPANPSVDAQIQQARLQATNRSTRENSATNSDGDSNGADSNCTSSKERRRRERIQRRRNHRGKHSGTVHTNHTDTSSSSSSPSSSSSSSSSPRTPLSTTVKPCRSMIEAARVVKSEPELQAMARAGKISADAFVESIKATKAGAPEGDLAARFEFNTRLQGSPRLAYPCVVGGGPNATVLHYTANDHLLREGELVLMDAGCEFGGYASDISRTWPVNGTYSQAQRELYDLVLDVQLKCIELCVADGTNSLHSIHLASAEMLQTGLEKLGLLLPPSSQTADMNLRTLYPHFIGHYLGMDTHDTHSFGIREPLEPNTVITIEPGLYIKPHATIPEQYHNIGIRIEDDVVVCREGQTPLVLTAGVPKQAEEVERLMATHH